MNEWEDPKKAIGKDLLMEECLSKRFYDEQTYTMAHIREEQFNELIERLTRIEERLEKLDVKKERS